MARLSLHHAGSGWGCDQILQENLSLSSWCVADWTESTREGYQQRTGHRWTGDLPEWILHQLLISKSSDANV